MKITQCKKTKEDLTKEYLSFDDNSKKLLESSYACVSETKGQESRIEELKIFCKKLEYNRIGIAFCKALRPYAEKLDKKLSKDFEVYSVCCNVCGIKKDDLHVKYIRSSDEPACNPIGQASVLNEKKPDIVLKCGFCLGHDMIFSKNIKSPTTTIFVKDRKLKHKTIEMFE